jgi:hypothetical protein
MTLFEIRKMLVDQTGRYDLVVDTTDYVDISADYFIKQGQKFLESRLPDSVLLKGKIITGIGEGDELVEVPHARAVHKVAIRSSEDDPEILHYLKQSNPGFIRHKFGSYDTGTPHLGRPLYWETNIGRVADEFSNDQDILRTLLIGPAADMNYEVVVYGTFFSRPLTSDTSQSFWSIVYPDLLIQAAMYKIEATYRNTEGANDHLAVIDEALMGMYHDFIEDDASGKDQMENSW